MILIADDDSAIRMSLKLLLGHKGYAAATASTPAEVMDFVRRQRPDLVLLDMNFTPRTTGDEGMTLLRQVKVFHPDVPVILITAWGSIPLAVEGMRYGAFDFITKPWDNRALLQCIDTALQLTSSRPRRDTGFDRSLIVGRAPALLEVLETIERVAPTDAPVLILGENGTGKELVAETLHRNSRRKAVPMVKVNLGGLSQQLFESEMFGYRKGAFTGALTDREGRFAVAEGGTIFLDEIGDLDLNSQVKLLRVLQEHTYEPLGDTRTRKADVRVVSATNADLPAKMADGTFREDLFYRINLITVTLPPLRRRTGDIPLLVDHILGRACRRAEREVPEVTPAAIKLLQSQPWPGNVRQLANTVERTLLVTPGNVLDARHFSGQNLANTPQGAIRDTEKEMIKKALAASNGNMTQAAAALGITRQALYRRIEKYGL